MVVRAAEKTLYGHGAAQVRQPFADHVDTGPVTAPSRDGTGYAGHSIGAQEIPMPNRMYALVVMGVSGCGKTSVATALCERLGLPMIEGDAFHSAHNLRKMEAGVPLDDDDRKDWLDRLGLALAKATAGDRSAVLTCSALKRRYRDTLRGAVPHLGFVFLELSREAATERVSRRPGHFMPASLVDSQFRDLEPPIDETGVLTVSALDPLPAMVDRVVAWWGTGAIG